MIRRFITAIVLFFVFYAGAFGFLPAPPRRIVSLAPALTESLYVLGVGDRLKGCTTYCKKPEEAKHKEKVGTLVEINVEKVLLLKPDLVLAMEFSDRKAVEKLKNLGIRVELFPSPKDFNHLCQSFLRLGQMVGREDRAKEIVDRAKKEAAFIRQQVEREKKIKIFWQLGAKPLFAATKGYFTNDYIEYAGGINIAADAKSGIYSREEVLKRNPDVIVIVTMGIAGEREKETWQTYSSINAVKQNQIYIVDSYKYCSPTPKGFVEALKELVGFLHPSISISSEKK
ncbi:MAG: ABC transporter substrate-binding protein [Candidatus Aminicenantes bacterium]|nr:ABC transporter substrate-binding protein [Candidatus Aminicenantes bacterium]NIM80621.1 ABC transporter substrate-binding protein [Candidatus Aminicenantes bacterium]NIN20002.1 ABC transporter substrate-binding protein [Candidatus Aminicenantes bacterium]NIN47980.1 ABC transporter substrate-binding protein [Candidatus Aminicenantes bacterium]NIN89326.1 ABC transporter substrate-binding protein [Candidatus Aminicenantes bacterium]